MNPLPFVVAVAFSTALLCGQSTWIVDNLGGPGTQFAQVQPAIQAAAPNDTILVRFGVAYQGFTINKPLRVVGLTGSGGYPPWSEQLVSIVGIPSGTNCELSNFTVTRYPFIPGFGGLSAQSNAGRIHVEGLGVFGAGQGVIEFIDCADVVVHDCQLSGMGQPVVVRHSTVRLGYCNVIPSIPFAVMGYPLSHTPAEALHVDNGTVILHNVFVQGANQAVTPYSWPQTSGLSAQNGTVICGPACVIRGGAYYAPGFPPNYGPGVTTFTGTLIRDPAAQVTSFVAATIQPTFRRIGVGTLPNVEWLMLDRLCG